MKKEEITLKNTKAEILDALNKALEREKNISKMKSNPEKEEKEKKVNTAIENSKKNVEANIFSVELINKFNELELAIQEEEAKLKDLYGIEKELNNLTVVANAGKDYLHDIELRKKEEEDKMNALIQNLTDEYKKKSEDLKNEYDIKAKTLKTERDREVEEYNYNLKRERQLDKNKWEDEKKLREDNLKNKEKEANILLEDVKIREKKLDELEKKVAEIPSIIDNEYERGKVDAKLELEKENEYKIELLKKDYQNKIDRQEDKINSLNSEIEKLNTINISLQEKMDKAYNELKELASKTVEANGGVKILGNNQIEKN